MPTLRSSLLQFSIATLLALTTLIALGMFGLASMRRLRESTAAIAVLKQEIEQYKHFSSENAGEHIETLNKANDFQTNPLAALHAAAKDNFPKIQEQYGALPDDVKPDGVYVVTVPTLERPDLNQATWRIRVPQGRRVGLRAQVTSNRQPVTVSDLTQNGPFVHELPVGESLVRFEWQHVPDFKDLGTGKLIVDDNVVFSTRMRPECTSTQSFSATSSYLEPRETLRRSSSQPTRLGSVTVHSKPAQFELHILLTRIEPSGTSP